MSETCCKKPNIQVFDYWDDLPGLRERTVNRVCLNCKTHWFGDSDNPTRYTKQEWDRRLNKHV